MGRILEFVIFAGILLYTNGEDLMTTHDLKTSVDQLNTYYQSQKQSVEKDLETGVATYAPEKVFEICSANTNLADLISQFDQEISSINEKILYANRVNAEAITNSNLALGDEIDHCPKDVQQLLERSIEALKYASDSEKDAYFSLAQYIFSAKTTPEDDVLGSSEEFVAVISQIQESDVTQADGETYFGDHEKGREYQAKVFNYIRGFNKEHKYYSENLDISRKLWKTAEVESNYIQQETKNLRQFNCLLDKKVATNSESEEDQRKKSEGEINVVSGDTQEDDDAITVVGAEKKGEGTKKKEAKSEEYNQDKRPRRVISLWRQILERELNAAEPENSNAKIINLIGRFKTLLTRQESSQKGQILQQFDEINSLFENCFYMPVANKLVYVNAFAIAFKAVMMRGARHVNAVYQSKKFLRHKRFSWATGSLTPEEHLPILSDVMMDNTHSKAQWYFGISQNTVLTPLSGLTIFICSPSVPKMHYFIKEDSAYKTHLMDFNLEWHFNEICRRVFDINEDVIFLRFGGIPGQPDTKETLRVCSERAQTLWTEMLKQLEDATRYSKLLYSHCDKLVWDKNIDEPGLKATAKVELNRLSDEKAALKSIQDLVDRTIEARGPNPDPFKSQPNIEDVKKIVFDFRALLLDFKQIMERELNRLPESGKILSRERMLDRSNLIVRDLTDVSKRTEILKLFEDARNVFEDCSRKAGSRAYLLVEPVANVARAALITAERFSKAVHTVYEGGWTDKRFDWSKSLPQKASSFGIVQDKFNPKPPAKSKTS